MDVLIISAMMLEICYLGQHKRWNKKGFRFGLDKWGQFTKQKKNNKKFAKVRAIVELPFAFIKNLMNYTKTRFIGLEKNDQYHLLLATAYNLRRVPNLQKRMTM